MSEQERESIPIEIVGIGEGQVVESASGVETGRENEEEAGTSLRALQHLDPRTTEVQVARRREVEKLLLSGVTSAREIAAQLGCRWETVTSDIEYIQAANAARPGVEELRSYVVRTMLDLAETARGRYREGESTVEGRLIVDALARLSKVTGLDEPAVQEEVGGALARFLDAMTDRANSD